MWKLRIRRISYWAAAPSTPVTMVAPAIQTMRLCVKPISVPKTSVNVRTSA